MVKGIGKTMESIYAQLSEIGLCIKMIDLQGGGTVYKCIKCSVKGCSLNLKITCTPISHTPSYNRLFVVLRTVCYAYLHQDYSKFPQCHTTCWDVKDYLLSFSAEVTAFINAVNEKLRGKVHGTVVRPPLLYWLQCWQWRRIRTKGSCDRNARASIYLQMVLNISGDLCGWHQ